MNNTRYDAHYVVIDCNRIIAYMYRPSMKEIDFFNHFCKSNGMILKPITRPETLYGYRCCGKMKYMIQSSMYGDRG